MSENKFTVGRAVVTIEQDDNPESPREWCNAGTMVCWHRNYSLGDLDGERNKRNPLFSSPQEFHEFWKENGKGGLILPLYLYDHSGLRISTGPFSCPWDSGQVGWVYATRKTILREWGKKDAKRVSPKMREQARACLVSEVAVYDQYLRGDVWGYSIECGPLSESCWGFYGFEYCEKEARDMAAHLDAKLTEIEKQTAIAECVP